MLLAEQPEAEEQMFRDCRHHEQLLIKDSPPTESFITRPGARKGFFFCHQGKYSVISHF